MVNDADFASLWSVCCFVLNENFKAFVNFLLFKDDDDDDDDTYF